MKATLIEVLLHLIKILHWFGKYSEMQDLSDIVTEMQKANIGTIDELRARLNPTTSASTPVCPQCKSTDTGYRCCACGTEFGADDDA